MLAELRQRVQTLQRPAGIEDDPGTLPLGIVAIDQALGGGLARGALHEIAAASEAHLAAATGFALGLVSLGRAARTPSPRLRGEGGERAEAHSAKAGEPGEGAFRQAQNRSHAPSPDASSLKLRRVDLSPQAGRGEGKHSLIWIAEDMALAESGAPYGPGLDGFGLAPERLLTVSVAHRRDLLWAMEEALRCRAVAAVIGELRHDEIDTVAVRRLSLAAAENGALAVLLRAAPPTDASTAATRWIVGACSPSPGGGGSPNEVRRGGVIFGKSSPPPGAPSRADLPPPGGGERNTRFAARLVRNRRGPVGSWIIEWSDSDECFTLATHAQPVAAPALDRSHRKIA